MKIVSITILLFLIFAFPLHALPMERTMALEEIFQRADSCSLTIKSAREAAKSVDANVKVAKNGLLPDINFSASATYNGNAWMSDRDFSNGQSLPSPHFGNNFALEVRQTVYAGELSWMEYALRNSRLI